MTLYVSGIFLYAVPMAAAAFVALFGHKAALIVRLVMVCCSCSIPMLAHALQQYLDDPTATLSPLLAFGVFAAFYTGAVSTYTAAQNRKFGIVIQALTTGVLSSLIMEGFFMGYINEAVVNNHQTKILKSWAVVCLRAVLAVLGVNLALKPENQLKRDIWCSTTFGSFAFMQLLRTMGISTLDDLSIIGFLTGDFGCKRWQCSLSLAYQPLFIAASLYNQNQLAKIHQERMRQQALERENEKEKEDNSQRSSSRSPPESPRSSSRSSSGSPRKSDIETPRSSGFSLGNAATTGSSSQIMAFTNQGRHQKLLAFINKKLDLLCNLDATLGHHSSKMPVARLTGIVEEHRRLSTLLLQWISDAGMLLASISILLEVIELAYVYGSPHLFLRWTTLLVVLCALSTMAAAVLGILAKRVKAQRNMRLTRRKGKDLLTKSVYVAAITVPAALIMCLVCASASQSEILRAYLDLELGTTDPPGGAVGNRRFLFDGNASVLPRYEHRRLQGGPIVPGHGSNGRQLQQTVRANNSCNVSAEQVLVTQLASSHFSGCHPGWGSVWCNETLASNSTTISNLSTAPKPCPNGTCGENNSNAEDASSFAVQLEVLSVTLLYLIMSLVTSIFVNTRALGGLTFLVVKLTKLSAFVTIFYGVFVCAASWELSSDAEEIEVLMHDSLSLYHFFGFIGLFMIMQSVLGIAAIKCRHDRSDTRPRTADDENRKPGLAIKLIRLYNISLYITLMLNMLALVFGVIFYSGIQG